MAAFGAFMGQMAGMGYPVAFVGVTKTPFDTVSDDYRGLRGSTLDLYRQPDKLQALMEMLTPMVIGQAIGAAKGSGNPRVFIPLHRGAAGFLSDEQFAKYYWPGLKAVIFALLEAGVTPCPFFEGDYTPRLKYLAELPPGVVAAHFDRTDRKKFKEIVRAQPLLLGRRAGLAHGHGHPRRGQGLRQGADRRLRRHRRAHHRRRQLDHRRGQAGERHGAARGRGRVRRVETPALNDCDERGGLRQSRAAPLVVRLEAPAGRGIRA